MCGRASLVHTLPENPAEIRSVRNTMRFLRLRLLALVIGLLVAATWGLSVGADTIAERARKLHFSSIVVDTHDDTTQRLIDGDFDLGPRNSDGSIDIPRMKEGGLG